MAFKISFKTVGKAVSRLFDSTKTEKRNAISSDIKEIIKPTTIAVNN